MAGPGPDGPQAGGPGEHDERERPPAATAWQPAKGRVYRSTGEYDEPQTIPTGFPPPALPKSKGPWALTHLTTSLTGDILGGRRTRLAQGEAKSAEPNTLWRIVVGMTVAVLVLAGIGLLGAKLLGLL